MPRQFSLCDDAKAQYALEDLYFLGNRLIDAWIPTNDNLTNISGVASSWRGIKTGLAWAESAAGSRPTITNFRGVPCLSFDGADRMILNSSGFGISNNVEGFTLAMAYSWSAVPTIARNLFLMSSGSASNATRFVSNANASGNEVAAFRRLDADTVTTQVQSQVVANAPTIKIISADYVARTTLVSLNGVAFTGVPSTTAGNTSATNSVTINLGATAGGFQGSLMGIVLAQAVLNQQEQDRLAGVLAWMTNFQSAIPASRPFTNFPPTIGG